MHEKLSHLSENQVNELVERYYKNEKISSLIEDYQIQTTASALVSLFPPQIHYDVVCPHCEVPLTSKYESRSGYRTNVPFCASCGHRNVSHCRCTNCTAQLQSQKSREENLKRAVLENRYAYPETYDVSQRLTFSDALYLLSLVRHSLSEDMEFVSPFSNETPLLAPTYELTNHIVKHLYAKGILSISHQSDTEAFEYDEEYSEIEAYYPVKVEWKFLPGLDTNSKRSFVTDVEQQVRDGEWPDEWFSEADKQWHNIGKYECFEYFDYLLRQRNFQIDKFGEKTHSVFEEVLKKYSIAQAFKLTWMAVRDTVDYLVKQGIPTYKGKNHFIGSVQRKAERFSANKWEVKPSRRDFGCPQSVLSSTYFNLFLEVGDQGFEAKLPQINAD